MDDFNTRSTLEQAGLSDIPDISSMTDSLAEIRENISRLRHEISGTIPPGRLSLAQTKELIENLPTLTDKDLVQLGREDSLCPICLNPLTMILEEEQTAIALDSPAYPTENLGVTKLSQPWQCGHIFCRRDISKWIQEAHDSCPMCRRLLVEPASDTTETRRPLASVESFDPDITELERQVRQHIDTLRIRLDEMRLSSPEPNHIDLLRAYLDNVAARSSPESNQTEDRPDTNEITGMYS